MGPHLFLGSGRLCLDLAAGTRVEVCRARMLLLRALMSPWPVVP